MIKTLVALFSISFLFGCGSASENVTRNSSGYIIHKNITTTFFWVGEEGNSDNNNISNLSSAWDKDWLSSYGHIDKPKENPFYFALPFNDFDKNGDIKKDILSYIPWAAKDNNPLKSICKNRWIKIIKSGKTAYAQWEDVGPFEEDDKDYVFGSKQPKSTINNHAGLDVSPAVKDYLNLKDIDTTTWEFIDNKDVPDGPWKEIITTKNINW